MGDKIITPKSILCHGRRIYVVESDFTPTRQFWVVGDICLEYYFVLWQEIYAIYSKLCLERLFCATRGDASKDYFYAVGGELMP